MCGFTLVSIMMATEIMDTASPTLPFCTGSAALSAPKFLWMRCWAKSSDLTAQVTGCDACLVLSGGGTTGEFVLRASLVPHIADLGNLRMKMGEGVTGWVAEHQAPVALSDNAMARSALQDFPDHSLKTPTRRFSRCRWSTSGKAIGVVNIHHRDRHEHSSDEIATISFIGEQIGSAIAKSLLEEENARLAEETAEMKPAAGNPQDRWNGPKAFCSAVRT